MTARSGSLTSRKRRSRPAGPSPAWLDPGERGRLGDGVPDVLLEPDTLGIFQVGRLVLVGFLAPAGHAIDVLGPAVAAVVAAVSADDHRTLAQGAVGQGVSRVACHQSSS